MVGARVRMTATATAANGNHNTHSDVVVQLFSVVFSHQMLCTDRCALITQAINPRFSFKSFKLRHP